MLSAPDFSKKQIIFIFFNEGEKLSFNNDNLTVKTSDGKIKFQSTCYRLFVVYAIGHCSITSVLIQRAKKFGFFIAMMTNSFRLYSIIGAEKEGNTLLKQKQYTYMDLEIARHITQNKICNQQAVLINVRNKSEAINEAIESLHHYREQAGDASDLNVLLAYEGLASKIYFRNHFNNIIWNGRQPRIKRDPINSVMDIGYTLLFTFIDTLLSAYGFDTYCGVLHRQFYMRKSLTCDIIEPFRPLIDVQIKKSINLKQFHEEDFLIFNGVHRLKWEKSVDYVSFLMKPIIENKDVIFSYIQCYYRAFLKDSPIDIYPVFNMNGAVTNGFN